MAILSVHGCISSKPKTAWWGVVHELKGCTHVDQCSLQSVAHSEYRMCVVIFSFL